MDYCPAKVDLHIHTTVSDGTDTPEEIVDKVRAAGIGLFSVTDHDAVKGCRTILSLLKENDPRFITGVEFSCSDEEGKYHILGYGYDPDAAAIRETVENGHSLRMYKVTARLDFLREKFGFKFPKEEIDRLLSMDNPGKPHIGNLMVRFGFAESRNQAILQYINKLHVGDRYLRPEEAITGILASGGLPVLAHPSFGSGDQLVLGEEMESRIRRLKEFGLQGLEAYYSGFTDKLTGELLSYADKYGLYVTAGSDYHGSNKLLELGDTGSWDARKAPDGFMKFYRDVRISEYDTI